MYPKIDANQTIRRHGGVQQRNAVETDAAQQATESVPPRRWAAASALRPRSVKMPEGIRAPLRATMASLRQVSVFSRANRTPQARLDALWNAVPDIDLPPEPVSDMAKRAHVKTVCASTIQHLEQHFGAAHAEPAAIAQAMDQYLVDLHAIPAPSGAKRAKSLMIALALRSMREERNERALLASAMAQHPAFNGVDTTRVWQMLMDEHAQQPPATAHWANFENEPGYMAGMYRGLIRVIRHDLQGVQPDGSTIEGLHDETVSGVANRQLPVSYLFDADKLNYQQTLTWCSSSPEQVSDAAEQELAENPNANTATLPSGFVGAFRTGRMFGLKSGQASDTTTTLTQEGFTRLVERAQNRPDMQIKTGGPGDQAAETTLLVTSAQQWSENCLYRIDVDPTPIDTNRERIDQAMSDCLAVLGRPELGAADKRRAIAEACILCEQNHPFLDGNARIFGNLLINRLLLLAGQSPAMIDNPNRIDGLSPDEFAAVIEVGQRTFASRLGGSQSM